MRIKPARKQVSEIDPSSHYFATFSFANKNSPKLQVNSSRSYTVRCTHGRKEDQRKSTVGEVGCRLLMKLAPAHKFGPKGLVTNTILPN